MAHMLDYAIVGDDMQLVEIILDPGEGVRAEVGTIAYMEDGIEMETRGGLLKGFHRIATGESFFITAFWNRSDLPRRVAFAAPYPGKIIALDLGALGQSFFCQKDAFLCAAHNVDIEVAFTKRLGGGIFGGEGFVLQRLYGDGLAFIHAGGTMIEKELMEGETVRVDTGCLVAFASTVDYDIQFVGGFKNALLGGEGVFLARLRGPGKVYLQSLPFSHLADRVLAAARAIRTRG